MRKWKHLSVSDFIFLNNKSATNYSNPIFVRVNHQRWSDFLRSDTFNIMLQQVSDLAEMPMELPGEDQGGEWWPVPPHPEWEWERNRVARPGSKIHYPVPNPGNWYPFLHWLNRKMQFWPVFASAYMLTLTFFYLLLNIEYWSLITCGVALFT